MRLFVALEVPPAVRDTFAGLMNDLRALTPGPSTKALRWVRPENLHVTLKFIGTIAPEKLDEIRTALSAVRSGPPLELRFRGLGFFPDVKRPGIVSVSVAGSQDLSAIASRINRGLAELGIPGETRTFTPHLTLARWQPLKISAELRSTIEKNAERDFGGWHANEFRLIESKLKPNGAEYTTLQSFIFAAEA